jgi:hypothetical protein
MAGMVTPSRRSRKFDVRSITAGSKEDMLEEEGKAPGIRKVRSPIRGLAAVA